VVVPVGRDRRSRAAQCEWQRISATKNLMVERISTALCDLVCPLCALNVGR